MRRVPIYDLNRQHTSSMAEAKGFLESMPSVAIMSKRRVLLYAQHSASGVVVTGSLSRITAWSLLHIIEFASRPRFSKEHLLICPLVTYVRRALAKENCGRRGWV